MIGKNVSRFLLPPCERIAQMNMNVNVNCALQIASIVVIINRNHLSVLPQLLHFPYDNSVTATETFTHFDLHRSLHDYNSMEILHAEFDDHTIETNEYQYNVMPMLCLHLHRLMHKMGNYTMQSA